MAFRDRIALDSRYGARIPIEKPGAVSEEINSWYWNPGLIGIQREPRWFRERLDEIDPDLAVCWNRFSERWQVFVRAPRVQTRLCRGWRYLFPVQHADGSYAPLDERTLAKIHSISADQQGNGQKYFDRIVSEMKRDKEKAEEKLNEETAQQAGEYFDYTLPKVGYGAISGSKTVGQ